MPTLIQVVKAGSYTSSKPGSQKLIVNLSIKNINSNHLGINFDINLII